MNMQIEELIAQTTRHYNPTFEQDKWREKFAELIVKDIIDTILINARWYQEEDKDANATIALCALAKDIREEYGVE
jgi:hypothetical protein